MKLTIKHDTYGEITIHDKIPSEIMEMIGDVTSDFGKSTPFYYADIIKNEDATFTIKDLGIIKSESFNVGWMDNSKGSKNFVTLMVNRVSVGEFIAYPLGIISVNYNEQ